MFLLVGGILNAYKNHNPNGGTANLFQTDMFSDDQKAAAQFMKDNGLLTKENIDNLTEFNSAQKEVLELMGKKDIGMEEAIKELGESAQESTGLIQLFKEKGVEAFKAVGLAIGNMLAAAAISFLATQAMAFIDEWINHTKNLNNSAREFGAQMKRTESDIDSYGERIAAQKSIIEDNKSSIEDVTTARAELYKIQSEMIAAYGGEGESIKAITDAINGQNDALDKNIEKLKEQQHQKAIEDFNKENDDWRKATVRQMQNATMTDDGVIIPATITAFEEFMDNMENYQVNLSAINDALPEKEFQDVIKKHADQNDWTDLSSAVGNVNQFVELYDELMDTASMLRDSSNGGISQDRYDYISKYITQLSKPARDTAQSNRDLYEQEMLHQIRQRKDLNDRYSDLSDLYGKYLKADTAELQREVYEAYSAAVKQIADDKSISYGIRQQFLSLYPDLKAEADKWTFEVNFKANKDGLRDEIQKQIDAISAAIGHAVTQEELDHWDDSQYDAIANSAYSNYARTLSQNGISSVQTGNAIAVGQGVLDTNTTGALKDFIEKKAPGAINDVDKNLIAAVKDVKNFQSAFTRAWNKIGKDVPNDGQKVNVALKLMAREAEDTAKTTEKELGGMDLSDVAKHLTKLGDVYDKLKKDGEVKWNTIDTKDFKESFGDIKDETGEFQKAWDNFHQILSSTPNDTKAVQDAFDTLASSYVYNSDCMKMLNENNKDLVIGMLSDNGVANAADVVNDALNRKAAAAEYDAFSEDLLAQKGVDLANVSGESATATLEGATAFLKQAGYAEEDQAAIARLILEQWALNGQHIDTSDNCNALADLAQMAGVAASQIIALNNAMAGGTTSASQASGGNFAMLNNGVDSQKANQEYQKAQREYETKKALEDIRQARENIRFKGSGGSGSGGGSGGGGGNKEPSKTDKEFDYVNRALQIMQEQNDELREKVDNQYVILQDAQDNLAEFTSASDSLNEAETKLTSLGVDTKTDDFKNFIATLDEVQQVNDEMNQMIDDTPGYVLPAGDTFAKVEAENYGNLIEAAREYKSALGDVEKAKEKVNSKTLDENGVGQLTFIKQLQESDKKLIEAYEHAANSYNTEWEEYKKKIEEAFKEDGRGEKYIQDIMYGNLDPEEWERMITYDSNNQAEKDKVELLERGQTAYDHQKEALKSMREWQTKLNEDVQKEYEMRLNIVKAEMVAIESRMNEAQHDLDMKEILGEVVQEADYQRLIGISQEQVSNYEKQLSVLKEQLGTLDEGEQAWYDCKSQIADCEQSIRDCVKQQAEWNDTILRMPVENISRFLGLIQNLGQTLENWLSVNDAKGIAQTAEQIMTSWTTAYDQIADDELGLMKQLEDYQDLLENYDLGQNKFSEVSDEIQSARDSVESLVEKMIKLNKQLLTLPIDKIAEMTTYLEGTLSDLQTVQSEHETAINTVIDLITREQEKLEDEYTKLEESIQKSIEPLQDQLDALQKANEARDRELAVEQALYELQKAREQKTVQVKLIA